MLNFKDILSTQDMIDKRHLDIRTITMGISLLDCCHEDVNECARRIYDKITRKAENLVKTGEALEREMGIPIVNKRISVTPMALVAEASETEDYVPFAIAMDKAADTVGVNFIGGFTALVQKAEALYEAADAYGALVAEKQALEDKLAVQNANYTAIAYAEKYLAQARENLSSRYLGKMQDAFLHRMQQMGGDGMQFSLDTDFGITLRVKGKSRTIEYLSSGWRDMVGFCLRLCLADGLFDTEKPCLVLDDPFVYLDTERALAARRLLDGLAQDYQILYLTCKTEDMARAAEQTTETE